MTAQLAQSSAEREELADLRVEKEFYRLAAQRVRDLDAAFKLADRTLITVADDDTINGLDGIVDWVIQNDPFLCDELAGPTTSVPVGPKEGGSAKNPFRVLRI